MIDWTQGNNWQDPGTWTISSDYGGWFHVYAFTMTLGMIFAVGYSAFKFWKKGIPVTQLAWGVIAIIPMSLFGASIFGKLNADGPGVNANGVGFWGLFAFWHAGMAIHGGVYIGTLTGLIVYGIMGHYTKVSLWTYMDCIIPNILLGQGIGRWGNFFNHEVMGPPVGLASNHPLSWLPHYIQVNTQWQYRPSGPDVINGIPFDLESGRVYQMAPIFLYESIALFIAWGLITFVLPNIGKWIGPKPWKKLPKEYHLNDGQGWLNFIMPWKYTTKQLTKHQERNESYFVIWNQAFYKKLETDQKPSYDKQIAKINHQGASLTSRRYHSGKALIKANNPQKYWITKVGAEAGGYFLAWNIVRFALELQRPYDHLFIMYEKTLSLVIIMVTAGLGLLMMILSQNAIAWFFRQPSKLYEKEYFEAPLIDKAYFYYLRKWLALNKTSQPKAKKSQVASKQEQIKATKKHSKEEKASQKLVKMQKKKTKG